jgi:ABC-type amino acid transport substrate-binding protein
MTIGLTVALFGCIGCGGGEATNQAFKTMEKNKVIRVAVDSANRPFASPEGTGVEGVDADIALEIGKAVGYEVKWYKCKEGNERLFTAVKNGEAEFAISAIAIDPSKEKEFAFSKPYFETGDGIALRNEKFDMDQLSKLSGKRVGVATGRPADAFMASQKIATPSAIAKFTNLDDALAALNRTEVDAVVGDEDILTITGFKSFQNTKTVPNLTVNKYKYAIVVKKGETDLLKKIDETLDRMKKGNDLEALKIKWIETPKKEALAKTNAGITKHELQGSPKAINVVINKRGGSWAMDILDGFILKLVGPTGTFESEPILTEGNTGRCKFKKAILPGDYTLNLTKLRMSTKVPVPNDATKSLTMTMNISASGITIELK